MPDLKSLIAKVNNEGLFLTHEAFHFLEECDKNITEQLVNQAIEIARRAQIQFISKEVLQYALADITGTTPELPVKKPLKERGLPEKRPTILSKAEKKERAVVFSSFPLMIKEGAFEGYLQYFRNRFSKLSKLFTKRGAVSWPIRKLNKLRIGDEASVIAMLSQKREARQRTYLTVEDLTGSALFIIAKNAPQTLRSQVGSLLVDLVYLFKVKRIGETTYIVSDIAWPDIPPHTFSGGKPGYAILTSDTHFGSKSFDADVFEKFLRWLNGEEGNEKLRKLAEKVEYLIIAGDIVEGIGVYPGQKEDLLVSDLKKQYEIAAEYFSRIPEHVKIILSPGNHDATRQALPQPPIFKHFAEELYADPRVYFVPNPTMVEINGVKILVYHGQSFFDIADQNPEVSINDTIKCMSYLLKGRHLSPLYGGKSSIAPLTEDHLVIEEAPDVFLTGHVHVFGLSKYHGVVLVNGGTWQKQTSYQVKQGITPTPGIAALLDLQTLQAVPIDFNIL